MVDGGRRASISVRRWGPIAGVLILGAALTTLCVNWSRPRVTENIEIEGDESRPTGVVNNYLVALANDDMGKAYNYLSSEARAHESYARFAPVIDKYFKTDLSGYRLRSSVWKVVAEEERITPDGRTARVPVRWTPAVEYPLTIVRAPKPVRVAELVFENGAWKLVKPEPFYWRLDPH